jgi:hypothetical protein
MDSSTHCSKEEQADARSVAALQLMKWQSTICLRALSKVSPEGVGLGVAAEAGSDTTDKCIMSCVKNNISARFTFDS